MGGAAESIFGLPPQVRIEFVASVLTAVTSMPHIEQAKQSVPNVGRDRRSIRPDVGGVGFVIDFERFPLRWRPHSFHHDSCKVRKTVAEWPSRQMTLWLS